MTKLNAATTMEKFKTGDIVKWEISSPAWLVHSPNIEFLQCGKIIGWFAQDMPIVSSEYPDADGNTAAVMRTSQLILVES